MKHQLLKSLLIIGLFVFLLSSQSAKAQTQPLFRFGINFPFRSPEASSLSNYLQLLNASGASAIRQMTFADVHWVQVEPTNDNWNFVRADSSINNPYGIIPIPTLYGISASANDSSIGLQVPWRACDSPGCGWQAARDSLDTKDYVQTVVKRYKSAVKFWEISNEMANKMRRPKGLPLPDFIDFMHMNYRWIKSADADARILISGLSGTYGLPLKLQRDWLRQFLGSGGIGSFDILNYHDYNSWWTLPDHLDSLKTVLAEFGLDEMPIWCTESSVSSDPTTSITPPYASEDEQAADVWRRPSVLFSKGVQSYFWHSMWSSGGQSEWREFGILSSRGKKKKAFHAYKLLVQKLDLFSSAQILSFGEVNNDNNQGGNGVWVVQFDWPNGTRRWVAWSPDNQSYVLNDLDSTNLILTSVVPTSLSADGERASFDIQQASVSGGTAPLSLNRIPILIEEGNVTNIKENIPIPVAIELEQNFPNPFNPTTVIRFQLPVNSRVTLKVFDVLGREVATLVDGTLEAGNHVVTFAPRNLAGGIYFYQITAGNFSQTRKALFIK